MNNEELKTGIASLKKIALSAREKEAMLKNIMAKANVPGMFPASIESPWKVRMSALVTRSSMSIVAATLLASMTSGFLAYAAEGSLPGDLLYPLKVNLSEPLQGALTFSKIGKVELAASIVGKRLQEEEALAVQGKLDPIKQLEINQSIAASLNNLDVAVKKTSSSSRNNEAKTVNIEVKERVSSQSRKIEKLINPKPKINIERFIKVKEATEAKEAKSRDVKSNDDKEKKASVSIPSSIPSLPAKIPNIKPEIKSIINRGSENTAAVGNIRSDRKDGSNKESRNNDSGKSKGASEKKSENNRPSVGKTVKSLLR